MVAGVLLYAYCGRALLGLQDNERLDSKYMHQCSNKFPYALVHAGDQLNELLYVLEHAVEQRSEMYACDVNINLSCFHYFPTFGAMVICLISQSLSVSLT